MARKRMIDPHIWEDPGFNSLSHTARILFIGMISNADDYGYIRGDAGSLKRLIFGFDEISKDQVKEHLKEILKLPSIHFFVKDGETYAHFVKWFTYQKQREDRMQSSVYPFCDKCQTGDGQVPAEEKLREVKRSKEKISEEKGVQREKQIIPSGSKPKTAEMYQKLKKYTVSVILLFAFLLLPFRSYAKEVKVIYTITHPESYKSQLNTGPARRADLPKAGGGGAKKQMVSAPAPITLEDKIRVVFGEYADVAIAIARAESGLRADAIGDGHISYLQDGVEYGMSYGIFQIRHLPGRPTPAELLDPDFNIKYAHRLFLRSGFYPWSAYTSKSYLEYL